MIFWNDFLLDDVVGPYLVFEDEDLKCRKTPSGRPSVMEDAVGVTETRECVSIQETRQEQRPARMVGLSSLESAQTGMDASRMGRIGLRRRGVIG